MSASEESETISMRSRVAEQGQLSRPDGSSSFCQGETMITCAVYGPSEVRLQKESSSHANVAVVYKSKSGNSGCFEKLLEHLVKNISKSAILLSHYPRTNIAIILQEAQNSASLLSTSVNAACLALIDSGLAMRCLIAGVDCVISTDDDIIVDPNIEQEKAAKCSMFFAFDSKTYSIIASNTIGIYSQKEYLECISICRDASKKIFEFYRNAVTRSYSKLN